uniref:TERF1 (TRF1)-interacting nuclear factor 2 n=1 Tax=Dicentrarchus labrax TaxID=13489 RepID=A0A8C4E5F7_DICLA
VWKVMQRRDVMQYGVVEEFVTSACEIVPGLLTVRHQGKLALGLRGRDDYNVTANVPKILESFHSMVRVLLTDATERDQFFKEEFPVDYGPKFDQELEKLLWEFLIRLDQLLPVPSLAQTVSWLSDAPPVLEECARAATQPQLLKILLEHQTCLGHLETAASLPPNMGDSILASLSLAPSGKVPSNQPTVGDKSAADKSDGTQKRNEGPVITPVIGLISNEDVPALMSANKKTNEHLEENLKFTVVKQRQNPKHGGEQAEEESNDSKRSSGMKRKQPDERESEEEEEEEEVLAMNRPGAKRLSKSFRSGDPSLCSIFVSCLSSQPRVVIEKLQVTSAGSNCSGRGGKSLYTKQQNQGRKSAVKAPTRRSASDQLQKPDSDFLDTTSRSTFLNTDDSVLSAVFSNRLCLPQLFMKRYYKTKHGTYVPTLREYWKPGMTRRDLTSTGSKHR